jgi:dCMP deaminase
MRISAEQYFIDMARLVSRRGTCARRQVGCVLVNQRNHVIATGYNGVASGMIHCTDVACPGVGIASGQGLDICEATHAEANALLQCRNVYEIHTAFVTDSPCIHCTKLLLNTGCKFIYFEKEYSHNSTSKVLWEKSGRRWLKWPELRV